MTIEEYTFLDFHTVEGGCLKLTKHVTVACCGASTLTTVTINDCDLNELAQISDPNYFGNSSNVDSK